MKDQLLRDRLFFYPLNGTRGRIECVHLQRESPYQLQLERNLLANSHAVDHACFGQSSGTNTPGRPVVSKRNLLNLMLSALPKFPAANRQRHSLDATPCSLQRERLSECAPLRQCHLESRDGNRVSLRSCGAE